MRIVHVIDYFQPKLGYQETFLARAHQGLGHEVFVVTSDRYSPDVYMENSALLGTRIKGAGLFLEEGLKVWRLKARFEFPKAIWLSGLEKKLSELAPDLVIVHTIPNFSAVRVARLKNRHAAFKLVYDDHMVFAASRSKMRMMYPIFRLSFSRTIQRAADGLVGVAGVCREFMHARYGIPRERIAVIPLGADHELFKFDPEARKKTRSDLSISQDDTVFVYAGKMVSNKGPHILVKAALKLIRERNGIKILLIGNGPQDYVRTMKDEVSQSGLSEHFVWRDAVPNSSLKDYYSASDVAVWPREASLSMFEAMACSLPVIISDASEITERVSYGNGLTYQGDNAESLSEQMKKLLDTGLRSSLGANGRKLVEEQLSWKAIASRFIALVERT